MQFVEEVADDSPDNDNIWVASGNGDIPRVQQLLQQGVGINEVDEHGYSPIHAAVSWGHVEMIQFLLSVGADINLRDPDGDTPLLICEEPEVFDFLVRAGADPKAVNTAGEGILEKVVEDENEVMIKYLIEQGLVDNEKAHRHLASIQEGENDDDDENGGFGDFQENDDDDNDDDVMDDDARGGEGH